MIRERPERLQSVEAVQVLLFTGGVFGGGVAAVYVRLLLCGSIAAFYVWCTPDMRFRCGVLHLVHVRYTVLLRRFVFDHACCLSFDKQDGLRNVAFLFRRVEIAIRAFSRCRCGYLPWRVHFGFVRFFMAISTGYRDAGNERRGYEGTGLAAWTLRVFAQPHWHCCAFRREYVGGCAPPNLRQRVFDSLDSLHLIRGVGA